MPREKDHILLELYVTNNGPLRFAEEDVGMSNAFYAGRGSISQMILSSEFNKLLGSIPVKTTLNLVLKHGDEGLDGFLAEYNWRNRQVKSLYGTGVDYSAFSAVFDGIIRFPEGMKRNNLRVAIVADDLRSKDSKLIPTELFAEDSYPDAPKSTIGKPIPILWGEFAYPLLIKPPCSDNSEDDGLAFKISGDTLKTIGDLYIIEEDGTKTKRNLEYVDGSKDLTNAKFRAGGHHVQANLRDLDSDIDHVRVYFEATIDDKTYVYAICQSTKSGSGVGFVCCRWDGDTWVKKGVKYNAVYGAKPFDALCLGSSIFVACEDGHVYRSDDGGYTWVDDMMDPGNSYHVNCLAVYSSDPSGVSDKVYAGTSTLDEADGKLQRRDSAGNWVNVWTGNQTGPISDMATTHEKLYFSCYGYGYSNGIIRSWDDTTTAPEVYTDVSISWIMPSREEELLFGSPLTIWAYDYGTRDGTWGSWRQILLMIAPGGGIRTASYDPNSEAIYFTIKDSPYPRKTKILKYTTGEPSLYWEGDPGDEIWACYFFQDYILWADDYLVMCNSLLTTDNEPTRLVAKFGIEASGRYESGGGDPLIEEPTDVIKDILEADLGVDGANIDTASFTAVQNILTNSGAAEFKVHRYLDKQIQAMELISELCAECEIMPSVRVSKYYLQYMWPSDESGTTYKQLNIRDRVFDTADCRDYFNKFSALHKYDPSTGNFEGTEIQEDGAAQAVDRKTVTKDLSCLWRYNGDLDHIPVSAFVSKLLSFFAANPEWVSATLKDTLDVELGDIVRLEIGHLSNVPVLVRSIRKDFLAKHTHIEGWNLRTAGDYPDSFWRLRDGEAIYPYYTPATKVAPGIAIALHGWYMHMNCKAKRCHLKFKITGDFTTIESNEYNASANGNITHNVSIGASINGLPDGTYAIVEIWASKVADPAKIWDVVFDMAG